MDTNLLLNYVNSVGRVKQIAFVGTNTGNELPFLKSISEKVYGFEPIPFESVWSYLRRHEDSKCSLFNVALSDKTENAYIYPASNNFESTSLLKPTKHLSEFPVNFYEPIPIICKRFDSFEFHNKCDFLIMDVQGAELRVLNGISDFSNIKLVCSEYTSNGDLYDGQCSFKELNAKLESHGFNFCQTFDVYQNPSTGVVHGNAIWRKL